MNEAAADLLCSQLCSALAIILRARERHSAWLLKEQGLTDQQLSLLRFIRDGSAPCVRSLADELCVSSPTAVGILGRLTEKGLLADSRVAGDGRKRTFSLTSKGLDALSQNAPVFSPQFSERLRSVSEWEARMIASGLHRLADLMTGPAEPGLGPEARFRT